MLNLETDTLEDLVGALQHLAEQIAAEGKENRRLTHRGSSSTFQATLRTDPDQDSDRYREQLAEWHRAQHTHVVWPAATRPAAAHAS